MISIHIITVTRACIISVIYTIAIVAGVMFNIAGRQLADDNGQICSM